MNAGLPSALDVARNPRAAFSALHRHPGTGGLAARLALLTILNGSLLAVLATGQLTFGLVLGLSSSWSLVVLLLQLLAAGALISLGGRRRALPLRAAISLFFLGHLPWSAWVLTICALSMVLPDRMLEVRMALLLAVPSGLWTLAIIVAFGREVLRLEQGEALVAALGHQAVVWGTSAVAVWWMSGGWARVPGLSGS